MSDDSRERSEHAARDASAPPNGSDGNQTMIQPDGHLDAEMVSAWLDAPEDFNDADRTAIERHLVDCAECRQIAAELTAIVRAFRTVPFIDVPRSFALTEEQAGLVATPTLPASRTPDRPNDRPSHRSFGMAVASPWYERQMSALRWATAVATLLFVFVFSADLLGNMDTGGDDDDSAAFNSQPTHLTNETTSLGASAEATNTPASVAAAPTDEDQAGDRSGAEEATPAGAAEDAAGSGEVATSSSGGSDATASTEEDALPPASAYAEPTAENVQTMLTSETPVAGQAESADLAQDDQDAESSLSQKDTAADDGESDVLRLIELALVTLIAWFIIAMVALPRLRRSPPS